MSGRLKEAQRLFHLGNGLAAQGRMDQAIRQYECALSIRPDYAEVHNNLGNAWKLQGQTDRAIKHYERAVSLRADYAEAHINLGLALAAQDRFDQAILHYNGMSAFPFSGAMEHSTNTSYGYSLINGGHNYDSVIAHELSHEWWGDSVGPETWADVWLNEGFASHSEALWFEGENGPQGYQDYMNSFWRQNFSGTLYNPADLFGPTVYDKGAWVMHMLRRVVGDAAFFEGLRDWYAGRRDGVGTTAELRSVFEARYGGALDWFFDEWVYGAGRPGYEYSSSTADPGQGSLRHYVRIRQVQPGGPFVMPVDLTLVTTGNDSISGRSPSRPSTVPIALPM